MGIDLLRVRLVGRRLLESMIVGDMRRFMLGRVIDSFGGENISFISFLIYVSTNLFFTYVLAPTQCDDAWFPPMPTSLQIQPNQLVETAPW